MIDRIDAAITANTRLLILNSLTIHRVMDENDIAALSALCAKNDIYLIGDEVYEHMVFDQAKHLSLCAYEDLYARSFVISSFGKTYHVTGWKVTASHRQTSPQNFGACISTSRLP